MIDKNIIQISCCDFYCLALSLDNYIYGWGSNECKLISHDSDLAPISEPIVIRKLSETIKSIDGTYNHSFALTFSTGRVITWGCYIDEEYMDWVIPGEKIIELFTFDDEVYCKTNESLYEIRDDEWIKID